MFTNVWKAFPDNSALGKKIFVWFGLVLRHTNTIKVIWCSNKKDDFGLSVTLKGNPLSHKGEQVIMK
jgi:hypothetical protein